MASETRYLYGPIEMTRLVNQAREIIAANLLTDGLIDKGTARKLCEEYSLLVVERGFLGKMIDKLVGIKDVPTFQMVKLMRLPQQEQDTQNDNNKPEGSA